MIRRLSFGLIVLLASGCSAAQNHGTGIPFAPLGVHHRSGSTPIAHVVIIMQENRSFDNFFYD